MKSSSPAKSKRDIFRHSWQLGSRHSTWLSFVYARKDTSESFLKGGSVCFKGQELALEFLVIPHLSRSTSQKLAKLQKHGLIGRATCRVSST